MSACQTEGAGSAQAQAVPRRRPPAPPPCRPPPADYIFASVWGHKVYTIYSILFIVFIILIIVTAFITIALTYFQVQPPPRLPSAPTPSLCTHHCMHWVPRCRSPCASSPAPQLPIAWPPSTPPPPPPAAGCGGPPLVVAQHHVRRLHRPLHLRLLLLLLVRALRHER